MAVCKQCGTSFTPTAEAPGCPACSSTIRRRPAAAAGTPAPRPRMATPGAPPAKAPAAKASAAKAPAAGAKVRRAPAAAPAPEREVRVHHETKEAGLIDDTTKYGLLATLALAIIVGTTVLIVMRKKAGEREREQAYQAEVQGIYDQLKAIDLTNPAGAQGILDTVKEKESLWRDHLLAADIELFVSRAKTSLADSEEKRATLDRFAALETELKKTDLAPERMKDLRRQLDEMEVRLGEEGPELVGRFAAARLAADKSYAQRLLEDARSFAAANPGNARQALARYQPAEDEIKALLDRAYNDKKEDLKEFYTPLYQEAIKEADVHAEALLKAEGENLPWIDCLAPPQATNWNASSVAGFSHQVVNGVLQIVGPDAQAGKMAVMSIGDREQWRHYQVDFEFVVEKGDLEWYFRLGRNPTNSTLAYPLRTVVDPKNQESANISAGKRYAGRVTLVGSELEVKFQGAGDDLDVPLDKETAATWASPRKGGMGFVILPEARARFTRLQVREIR